MVSLPAPCVLYASASVTAPLGNGGDNRANLDMRLRLLDGQGRALAAADPPPFEGLGASLSALVPAGQHYLELSGTGWGDLATTGYSSYGSLGGRLRLLQPAGQPASKPASQRVHGGATGAPL